MPKAPSFQRVFSYKNRLACLLACFDTGENEQFNFHNFGSLQGFIFHQAVVSDASQHGYFGPDMPWTDFDNIDVKILIFRISQILKNLLEFRKKSVVGKSFSQADRRHIPSGDRVSSRARRRSL